MPTPPMAAGTFPLTWLPPLNPAAALFSDDHHGLTSALPVTTASVSRLPQLVHRKRSLISGTSPFRLDDRSQVRILLTAARLAPDQ